MQRPKGKIALKNYKENIITNKRVFPLLSLNIPKYHNSVEKKNGRIFKNL